MDDEIIGIIKLVTGLASGQGPDVKHVNIFSKFTNIFRKFR